ncbi:MAG: DUF2202 domain-containing protein [Campylobacteraceae bacterium]|nr:DUF2202 domain-containing protein [Campylobacteraceae bacterium]
MKTNTFEKESSFTQDLETNENLEDLVLNNENVEKLDFSYLEQKRVDLNLSETALSQVLRIAVYDEMQAYETYSAILENLGDIEPFSSIKQAEAVHYSVLISLLEKYEIDVPLNDWTNKLTVPNTYIECCEVGVATEIVNIKMYDDLLKYIQEEDVKDVLYRLQAASYNNHLPLFRNCVKEYYNKDAGSALFNPEEMMNKASEYQNLLEDIATGNIDQDKITQLLGKMNVSMVSGAALGAASSAFLSTYLNKNEE